MPSGAMLLLSVLLLRLLQGAVAFNDSINTEVLVQVLEDLASESLGVGEIQVIDYFFHF